MTGIMYTLTPTNNIGHNGTILKINAYRKTHLVPHSRSKYLVTSITMRIPLAPYPIDKNISTLRFVKESLHIGFGTLGMHFNRIFQHIHFGITKKKLHVLLQGIRTKYIIRIHKSYILTLCYRNTLIACSAEPAIVLMDYLYTRILSLQFITKPPALVRRAIIHKYNLIVCKFLCHDRTHAAFKILLHIIYRYDNT